MQKNEEQGRNIDIFSNGEAICGNFEKSYLVKYKLDPILSAHLLKHPVARPFLNSIYSKILE